MKIFDNFQNIVLMLPILKNTTIYIWYLSRQGDFGMCSYRTNLQIETRG